MRESARQWISLLFLLVACPAGAAVATTPRVYILLIDGFDARRLNEQLTPTLWALIHAGVQRTTFYPDAHAVMPSVTNVNHAAIVTATYAAAHGIVGNSFWERKPGMPPTSSEFARFLQVETLFTVIEKERPALTTAAVFGKSRLVNLFAAVPQRQRRPDVLWGDVASETETPDAHGNLGSDQRTMDEVLRIIAEHDPDFMFAALPDVDRASHTFGPDANEARKAVLEADRQVHRLIEVLQRRGSWSRTVLMITADHGFGTVEPSRADGRPYPLILFGRELLRAGLGNVTALASGALETISLAEPAPPPLDARDAQHLAQIRALALAQPEIAEAWYRLPNPADGGDAFTLAQAHPEWRIDHPRVGELVLLARPHCHFGDPFSVHLAGVSGNHGGPDEAHIPILITGGDPRVRAQIVETEGPTPQAANPDLGATAAWLLGVRMPRTVDGKAVPKELAGRVLREAFQ